MNPPIGMPSISPVLIYTDLGEAAGWLCAAFGFEERLSDRVTDDHGVVHHAELELGNGLIILSRAYDDFTAPGADAAHHQLSYIFVDDAAAHHDRSKASGAVITSPLRDADYGARVYGCRDPFGHHWIFAQQF